MIKMSKSFISEELFAPLVFSFDAKATFLCDDMCRPIYTEPIQIFLGKRNFSNPASLSISTSAVHMTFCQSLKLITETNECIKTVSFCLEFINFLIPATSRNSD